MEAEVSVPEAVLAAYGLDGAQSELLTGGRTNRTLRVRAGRDLVLQQMLGSAHNDPLGVMENLVRVTSHLDWRRAVNQLGDSWYPTLVPAANGKPFLMSDDGDVWRAFVYRPGHILRSAQPLSAVASAAGIYGRFCAETADLGGPDLITTAPGFHDLDQVYVDLLSDLEAATPEQRADIEPDVAEIQAIKSRVDRRCADDGIRFAPDRVVHNDTKLSNVLFDSTGMQATAVLDLDLAMMGPAWHDLGDLVRSSCWHAPHGHRGAPPHFSTELFQAVAGAYVSGAAGTLSDEEIATFAAAGPRLSLELGLRYLNDHLRDEPHLHVKGRKGHLVRGRANVKLAREMLDAYDALRQIVTAFVTQR